MLYPKPFAHAKALGKEAVLLHCKAKRGKESFFNEAKHSNCGMARAPGKAKTLVARKMQAQAQKNKQIQQGITQRNLWFVAQRESQLKKFGKELSDKKDGLEPNIRSVSIKFTQLPFGFITDSCGGHFSNKKWVGRNSEVFPGKLTPGKHLYFKGANFEMHLDHSPEANEFRAALENVKEKHPWVTFLGSEGIQMDFGMLDTYRLDTLGDVQKCKTANRRFLEDFEKVVNRFVRKYGIGRPKLRKP